VYTSYVGPDAPGTQPWLLPPSFAYGQATPAAKLSLPNLWTGAGNVSSIAFANADFVLSATSGGGAPTKQNVVVNLQLTGTNAWNTSAASRAALRANYLAFVAGVEQQLEIGSPALLVPGSTALIASSIVQYMPLPLSEILLYACGLETGIGTGAPAAVDLTPGMRLRSEPSLRQYLAPPNGSLGGYVSTGTLEWIVSTNVSTGSAMAAFDPFLGTIAAPQVVPPPAAPAPAYGLLDLQQTGATFKYYRLIYPQNIVAGSSPGSSGATNNVQLTGSDTLAGLRSNPPYSTWFFGRDAVIPEVAIVLQLGSNGAPQPLYVPVGTTLTNLLERFTRWLPLNSGQNVLQLRRLALSPNQGSQGAQIYSQVKFQQPSPAVVNDLTAFPVPLLPGDLVTLTLGTA
jgi:hypothetical protein